MAYDGDGATSGLHSSNYAEQNRRQMKLINEVRATGAAFDVDLPSIVVIGNQSSGKSSLIEAISGAWTSGEKEVDFLGPIPNPSQVETAVSRAQLAILNPSVDYKKFREYELPNKSEELPLGSTKQFSFSKNVVCLEISGPQVTDLTLIDLPGIIKNVGEGEDPANIDLIENLVKDYIQKDCLILLTITMGDDYNNQAAARLAKEIDQDRRKTIGVLTKPDVVQPGDYDSWISMIKAEKEKLQHGYFVTRNPTTADLKAGITFEAARLQEDKYFSTSEPWCSSTETIRARTGTKNLTKYLSEQLMRHINARLVEKINQTHDETEAKLRDMPTPPSEDPIGEMLRLIAEFQREMEAFSMGTYQHKSLIQDLNRVYAQHKRQIRETAPICAPFTTDELLSDATVFKRLQSSEVYKNNDPSLNRPSDAAAASDATPSGEEMANKVHGMMTLDGVRQMIEEATTRELPGNVPWDVKLELIERVLEPWRSITLSNFEAVKPILQKLCDDLVSRLFGKYEQTLLTITIRSTVNNQLAQLAESTKNALDRMVKLDDTPFTQNTHYFSDKCDMTVAALNDLRCPPISSTLSVSETARQISAAISALSALGYQVKEQDLKKLHTPSEWEREIKVMAEVRAYWQVAYKRIADQFGQQINAELLTPLRHSFQDALRRDLDLSSSDSREKCRAYLSESPEMFAKRKELQLKRDRLLAAKEAVHRFARGGSN